MINRVTQFGASLGRQSQLQSMQADLASLTNEVASGRKSNLARGLGVGVSVLYRLYDDVQQGDAFKGVATVAGKRLDAMQSALTSANQLLGGIAAGGLQAGSDGSGASTTLLASQARQAMGTFSALLNTQLGGASLFGGSDSATLPMAPVDAAGGPLETIRGLVTGPVDGSSVAALLDSVGAIFDGSGGTASYNGLFYRSASGSDDPPDRIHVAPGQTLEYRLRGDDQGFKDGMQALSLLSLLDAKDPASGAALLDADARAAVLDKANSLLPAAQNRLTVAAGTLGVTQQRLQTVSDIQDKAVAAATAQITSLESADYYTASARINALKVQLQATYSLTASLADLSLVNYLR